MSPDTSPSPTHAAADPAPPRAITGAGGLWWVGAALGLVSIVIGVLVVAWPKATVTVVAVLFGLNLLIDGAMRVVQAILTPAEGVAARVLYGILGIVSIVIGVLCLRHLLQTVAVLVLLVGLSWLIGGIIQLVVALSAGPPTRWTIGTAARLSTGLVAVAAGMLILAYPKLTLGTFVVLLGGSLVVYGAVSLISALQARRAEPS